MFYCYVCRHIRENGKVPVHLCRQNMLPERQEKSKSAQFLLDVTGRSDTDNLKVYTANNKTGANHEKTQ